MRRALSNDDVLTLRDRLLGLPLDTLFTAREAAIVTGLSEGALSNRRALGMWPYPYRIPNSGRIVRYRHGDLLAHGASREQRRADALSERDGRPAQAA